MRLTTKHYELRDHRFKRPMRIAQVSDLHDCLYGAEQVLLVAKLKDFQPNCIVITGDLFNRRDASRKENAFCFVRHALTIAPVYFAEGNHEVALKEVGEANMKQLSDMGVTLLFNESAEQESLHIIGLKQYATAEELSDLLDADRFNLVLSHRPERFPELAKADFELMLSGHAHGGQIRFANRGLFAPQQGLFPKYTQGLYQQGAARMIVSSGLGDTVRLPRILNPHELVCVTIRDCKS